ncbi:MAG: hypothetical protein HQM03_16440 [Magnetococcales bacterium]|nr:hypothetical protein [Magnetococcales bacterium]
MKNNLVSGFLILCAIVLMGYSLRYGFYTIVFFDLFVLIFYIIFAAPYTRIGSYLDQNRIIVYTKRKSILFITGLLLCINLIVAAFGSILPANLLNDALLAKCSNTEMSFFCKTEIYFISLEQALQIVLPALVVLLPLAMYFDRLISHSFVGYWIDSDGTRTDLHTGSINIGLREETIILMIDALSKPYDIGLSVGENFSLKMPVRRSRNNLGLFIEKWREVDYRAGLISSIKLDGNRILLKSHLLNKDKQNICKFFLGYLNGMFKNCCQKQIRWEEIQCQQCPNGMECIAIIEEPQVPQEILSSDLSAQGNS